jgi:predicted secreted protein
MSENKQTPYSWNLSAGQTLTLLNARSVSVLADGGAATIVTNSGADDAQTTNITDGTTWEATADQGNTYSTIVVTAAVAAVVVMQGGTFTLA